MQRVSFGFAAVATVLLTVAAAQGAEALLGAYLVTGLGAVIAVVVGLRRHRPENPSPWRWLSAAVGIVVTSQAARAVTEAQQDAIQPSWFDIGVIGGYVCAIVGVGALLRSRSLRNDLAVTLDALLFVGAFGAAIWILVLGPYITNPDIAISSRWVNGGYSLLDLGLAVMVARLALSPGRKSTAYKIMALGAATMPLGGVLVTLASSGVGDVRVGTVLAASGFVTLGASALHPSMTEVATRAPNALIDLHVKRLAFVVLATLTPPALLAFEILRGRPPLLAVALSTWIILSSIGIGRLGELTMGRQKMVSRQQQQMKFGQALVGAASRDEIHEAAIGATLELTSRSMAPIAAVVFKQGDGYRATSSTNPPGAPSFDLVAPHWLDDVVHAPSPVEILEGVVFPPTGRPTPWLIVVPITSTNTEPGALLVAVKQLPDHLIVEGLQSIVTNLTLALATATITEALHRQASDRRFEALVENSADVVMVLDRDLNVSFASPQAKELLGVTAGASRQELADRMPDADRRALRSIFATAASSSQAIGPTELHWNHDDGSELCLEVTITDLHQPELDGIVVNAHDVTDRKSLEESLRHQALHDSLTGLANRFLFQQRVSHALIRRKATKGTVGVAFIDLDDFKTLNDSLGHSAGDQVLKLVARRLGGSLSETDTAARLGGDEFAVLLESLDSEAAVLTAAEELRDKLSKPFTLEGRTIDVSASLGVAFADDGSLDADILLRNADVAMYTAKKREHGGLRVFEEEMHASVFERLELRTDLANALRNDELHVAYQPILTVSAQMAGRSMADSDPDPADIAGFEALMRWTHPEKGPISPGVFIPIAEESGLIAELGQMILATAVADLARWQAMSGRTDLFVSVNASVEQLHTDQYTNEVAAVLAANAMDPACVTIEVTESVLAEDLSHVSGRLHELHELGVEIAIDDFGTGYASLSYLQDLPLDKIKVDKKFIDQLSIGGDDRVVTSIFDLAESLSLPVVAEGVETQHQAHRLSQLECTYVQGFYFGRPAPFDTAARLIGARAESAAQA